MNPDAKSVFELVWHSKGMENLHQIEMPPMDKNTLQGMLKALGQSYRETYLDEIAKMTEIVNEQKTIKTKEMGQQWTKIFKDKWQVD